MEADESADFEFNEADFADYSSDYSEIDSDDDIGIEELDEDEVISILNDYDNYPDIGGFDLSPFEKHAREVFLTYSDQVQSTLDLDSEHPAASSAKNEDCETTMLENSVIKRKGFVDLLETLDIEATAEESETLFKYLDVDEGGTVSLDEFLPWYAEAIDAAQQTAGSFQNLVQSRRTVHKFDATEVDDGVLRRALECAIAAPNRSGTEPWRFIKLGKQTMNKVYELKKEIGG